MIQMAARSLVWVGKTLLVGNWSARLTLLGLVVALLAFGGSMLGTVTVQTLGLVLTLFMLLMVFRLLVGGGRR